MIEQRIRARAGAYSVPAVVHAVQGDTGRVFVFELEDYTITGAEGASLNCMRPDGSFYTYAGTVSAEDNTVTVALDVEGGALTQEGVCTFQLELTEAGLIVCTFRGSIIVEPVVGGEATQEEKDFRDAIQAQLNDKASNAQLAQVESDLTHSIDAVADDLAQEILDRESADATKASKSTTINGKSLAEDRTLYVQDIPSNDTDPTSPTYAKTNVELTRIENDSIALASGWTVNGDTSPQLYKSNRLVTFNLSSYPTSFALSVGWNTVGTLPQGFRPPDTVTFNATLYGSGNLFLKTERVQLQSGGTLQVYSQTARSDVTRIVIFGSYISA